MKFPSLTHRFVVWFIVVSALPILLIGAALLSRFEAEMRKEATNHVAAIADTKLDDINSYLNERIRDAAVLAQDETTLQATREFAKALARGGISSAAYRQLDARYRRHFKLFAEASDYYDVFLISPQGTVVYSNDHEADFMSNLLTGPYRDTGLGRITRQALTTLQGNLSDFDHYAPSGGKIAAFIAAPIVAGGKVEGVVALQFNNDRVWDVLTDRIGLGVTGETVVTRLADAKTALVMAPLNADPDATLKRRIPLTVNATRLGLTGQRGSGFTLDYRGIPVVAAWRYLPRMGWGMAVKTDVSEALAPVYRMRVIALAVSGLTLLMAILGALSLGRGIVNPLRKLSRAAEGLARGNLDERVAVAGQDEVGQLGLSFNAMAAELSSLAARQRQAQKELRENNESLELRVEERTATLTEVADQLRRERAFAEKLIEAAPVIVLLLSPAGAIQLVNRYCEDLTGYNRAELRGKDWIDTLLPERDRALSRSLFLKSTQGMPGHGNVSPIVTRSGEERLIEWSDTVLRNDAGEPTGLLAIGMDITERVESTRALSLREAQLNEAQRMARIGSWERDLVTDELTWTDEVYRIVEWDKGFSAFVKAIHPDDQAMVHDIFIASRETRMPLQVTHRLIMPDGRVKWVEERAQFHYDGEGKALRLVGTMQDISERMALTQILSRSQALLQEAQRMARVGSWDLDLVTGKPEWSDEVFHMFEIDRQQSGAAYDAFVAAIHPQDREMVIRVYDESVISRLPYQLTHRLLMPDGRIKWVEVRGQTYYDETGQPLQSVGTVQDISEHIAAEEQLRRSLAEKETLLREIHHRVKNNLQIVSSLLYFQAKKVKNPDDLTVMTESRDRLRAMILVHETLYQSNDLSGISFGGYLKTLVSQLADAHAARQRRISVRVETGNVALPIETALSCGMIVCELVVNVFKYAFPDGREGDVVVGIEAADGEISLRVSDNGIGLPEGFMRETTDSFGWQLINSLSLQIGASIAVTTGQGTSIMISFPYTEVTQ